MTFAPSPLQTSDTLEAKVVIHNVQNAKLWLLYMLAFEAIQKEMEEVSIFTCETENMAIKCTEYVQTLSSSLFIAGLRKQT